MVPVKLSAAFGSRANPLRLSAQSRRCRAFSRVRLPAAGFRYGRRTRPISAHILTARLLGINRGLCAKERIIGQPHPIHDEAAPVPPVTIISLYRERGILKRLRTARGVLAKITTLMLPTRR